MSPGCAKYYCDSVAPIFKVNRIAKVAEARNNSIATVRIVFQLLLNSLNFTIKKQQKHLKTALRFLVQIFQILRGERARKLCKRMKNARKKDNTPSCANTLVKHQPIFISNPIIFNNRWRWKFRDSSIFPTKNGHKGKRENYKSKVSSLAYQRVSCLLWPHRCHWVNVSLLKKECSTHLQVLIHLNLIFKMG